MRLRVFTIICGLLFWSFFTHLGIVFAQAPTPPAEQPFQPIVPELGVPIPGLEFTPATREGANVVVAYFAEYVNAGYRYLVGVILIVSIIMVVYGGFRYLLGSADVGNISRAKEIIRDAIAGMLLIIGAFLILQTVNPATTDLRALQLSSVQRQAVDLNLLRTTEVTGLSGQEYDAVNRAMERRLNQREQGATEEPPSSFHVLPNLFGELVILFKRVIPEARAASSELAVLVAQASRGRRTAPPSTNCPVTLEAPYDETAPNADDPNNVVQRSPRTLEFIEKMIPRLGSGSLREKIVKMADASAKCGVTMGSCGATVRTINQVAGLRGLGTVVGSGATLREARGSVDSLMRSSTSRCNGMQDLTERADCKAEAIDRVDAALRRSVPGYPDSWVNDLREGDILYVYNVSNSVDGQHSFMFMGWQGTRGEAKVVQGGRFEEGVYVRTDPTVCLKAICTLSRARGGTGGRGFYPVTKVFRPE